MSQNIKRKHGRALTIFLIIQLIIAVIGIFALLAIMQEFVNLTESSSEISLFEIRTSIYLNIAILILTLICVFGIRFWRIWGYWGLLITYGASILIAVLTGQVVQIVVNLIWLAIFYLIMRNKKHLLLWKL